MDQMPRQPQQQYQPQAPQMHQGNAPQRPGGSSGSRGFTAPSTESKITLFLVTIAALVVVIGMAGSIFAGGNSTSAAIASDKYQAVFLSNGQVYFGKLSSLNGEYITLTDIYYPQFEQAVQPRENDEAADPQVTLAKLGNELHGPEDAMFINRDEVVFWENLKNDGQVAEAISSHKSNGQPVEQPTEGTGTEAGSTNGESGDQQEQ